MEFRTSSNLPKALQSIHSIRQDVFAYHTAAEHNTAQQLFRKLSIIWVNARNVTLKFNKSASCSAIEKLCDKLEKGEEISRRNYRGTSFLRINHLSWKNVLMLLYTRRNQRRFCLCTTENCFSHSLSYCIKQKAYI